MRTFRMCSNQWENVRFTYFPSTSFVCNFLAFSCAKIAGNNSNGNHLAIVISIASQKERRMEKKCRNGREMHASLDPGENDIMHIARSLLSVDNRRFVFGALIRANAGAPSRLHRRTKIIELKNSNPQASNFSCRTEISSFRFHSCPRPPRRRAILRQQCHSSAMACEMETNRLLN